MMASLKSKDVLWMMHGGAVVRQAMAAVAIAQERVAARLDQQHVGKILGTHHGRGT